MSKPIALTELQIAESMKLPKQHQGLAFDALSNFKTSTYNLAEHIGLSSEGEETKNVLQVQLSFGGMKQPETLVAVYEEAIAKRKSGIKTHVETGIAALDLAVPHLNEEGNLVVVAGRPGMGKSSLGYQFLLAATRQNRSAFFFSLEMTYLQIVERHVAAYAGVSILKLRNPNELSEDEELRIAVALRQFAELPLLIDDKPKSIDEIVTLARTNAASLNEVEMPPLGLILVDYLTIVSPSQSRSTNELEIKEITRKLKALAKELKVPVIALSQLNRSLELRQNKRPQMSDLRESGSIEQEADEILFVYRDDVYNPDTHEKGVAELITGKRRMFDKATVKLKFDGPRMLFCDPDMQPQKQTTATKYSSAKGGRNGAI